MKYLVYLFKRVVFYISNRRLLNEVEDSIKKDELDLREKINKITKKEVDHGRPL